MISLSPKILDVYFSLRSWNGDIPAETNDNIWNNKQFVKNTRDGSGFASKYGSRIVTYDREISQRDF